MERDITENMYTYCENLNSLEYEGDIDANIFGKHKLVRNFGELDF